MQERSYCRLIELLKFYWSTSTDEQINTRQDIQEYQHQDYNLKKWKKSINTLKNIEYNLGVMKTKRATIQSHLAMTFGTNEYN